MYFNQHRDNLDEEVDKKMQEFSRSFIDLIHERVKTNYHLNLKHKGAIPQSPNSFENSFTKFNKNQTQRLSTGIFRDVNKQLVSSENGGLNIDYKEFSKTALASPTQRIKSFKAPHNGKIKEKRKKVKSYFNIKSEEGQYNLKTNTFESNQGWNCNHFQENHV